jgi:predicted alpha/beta-hydrolase family hydrolase
MRIILSHGQESGPGATKIQALAALAKQVGIQALTPDYGTTAPAYTRIEQLVQLATAGTGPLILAGSSMGAYISGMASLQCDVAGLFLMAPPVFFDGKEPALRLRAPFNTILHGWHDELIDPSEVYALSRAYSAKLVMLDDSHRLQDSIPEMQFEFSLFLKQVMLSVANAMSGADET